MTGRILYKNKTLKTLIPNNSANILLHTGRAVLCTSKKGSLTVEASVILPIFLLAMTMLISMIDICRIQVTQSAKLAEEAKSLAKYAYATEGIYALDVVDLYETYRYELPVTLFPTSAIPIAIRGRVHAWTGRTASENTGTTSEAEEMVYVTESGGVFHTNSACTYLDLSIHAANGSNINSMRNEYGAKYHACDKCASGNPSGICYITDKGDRYHTSYTCSGLKRTVRLIRKSEASGMHICTRCAGT